MALIDLCPLVHLEQRLYYNVIIINMIIINMIIINMITINMITINMIIINMIIIFMTKSLVVQNERVNYQHRR